MASAKFSPWERYWQAKSPTYPNEHLIRAVCRAFPKGGEGLRALDVGAGTGVNSVFLVRRGFAVDSVEGSHGAVERAKCRFLLEEVEVNALEGDAVKLPFPAGTFDLVVDVAAIQHNKRDEIMGIVNEIQRVLKPGGMFFGLMRADGDYLFGNGDFVEKGTYADIPGGDLVNTGVVHFFDLAELEILFKEAGFFSAVEINYTERSTSGLFDKICHWVVTCRK